MNRPCPTKITCLDSNSNPLANLSSEGPELFYYIVIGYCCDGSVIVAQSTEGLLAARDELVRKLQTDCPECGLAWRYCADVTCPDGTFLFEVCVNTSPQDALDKAAELSAQLAPYCPNPDDDNTFRYDCSCPDGSDPHTVYSTVSEEVARAICEAIPKICNVPQSDIQSCTVDCPDGTTFTYTLPAGAIYAESEDLANKVAHSLACARALALRVCLGPVNMCACADEHYSQQINATGTSGPLTWSLRSGTIPPGLNLRVGTIAGASTVLEGVPYVPGHYIFTIRAATTPTTYAEATYHVYIIKIMDTSLPYYEIGQSYSHQLTASGGTGSYAWSVASGTLPHGIDLSVTGLLSGTPTGLGGGGAIAFRLVDTACEAANAARFTPRIYMRTNSTTTVRTWHGWMGYAGNPTLYKRITPTGTCLQKACVLPDGFTTPARAAPYHPSDYSLSRFCGGAKYVYSGYSEIDIYGQIISVHRKDLWEACLIADLVRPRVWGPVLVTPDETEVWTEGWFANINYLFGYCWPPDPQSCNICKDDSDHWYYTGDWGIPEPWDYPKNMALNLAAMVQTPTTLSSDNDYWITAVIGDPATQIPTHWVWPVTTLLQYAGIETNSDWSIEVSDPYTDYDAERSKVQYHSNGKTAENNQNYLSWVTGALHHRSTRVTGVSYQLQLSNLVADRTYMASVEYWYSSGGVMQVPFTFVASGPTQIINGVLPTPAAGTTITVKNPRVVYS